MESFQDDFRECPQNINIITPDNELICYNATTKVDVESKFLYGSVFYIDKDTVVCILVWTASFQGSEETIHSTEKK